MCQWLFRNERFSPPKKVSTYQYGILGDKPSDAQGDISVFNKPPPIKAPFAYLTEVLPI